MTTPPKNNTKAVHAVPDLTLEQRLAHRIQAITSACTPTQKRQATSAFARMIGELLREYSKMCPMQRYCASLCAATQMLGEEVRMQEKLLKECAPELARIRNKEDETV